MIRESTMSNAGSGPADHDFGHGSGAEKLVRGTMTSTTRYLSGAAYVDEEYAAKVIEELVANSHRAVAPTLDYDVTTVIRHCFLAQRLWLVQNALLFVILTLGLIILPAATMSVYGLFLLAHAFLGHKSAVRKWPMRRVAIGVVVAPVVVICLAALLPGLDRQSGLDYPAPEFSGLPPTDESSWWQFLCGVLAVAVALLFALTWSRYRMIMSITTRLGRTAAERPVRPEQRAVEQRLNVIDTAQHGNVVLHARFEPFIGAGTRSEAWSIATELRPDAEPEPGAAPAILPVDPVELVAHLRRRLAAMRSHDLPDGQRITGLQLRDQVMASGTRWRDYPLIDERVRLPYSYAGPEAVDAIIRAPQTSARHFLRAAVGALEKPATDAAGRTIMPAEHQSIVTSTYLHVAVEGSMLYVELVSSVLGPIQQRYLDIDRYDGNTDHLGTALREAVRRLATDTVLAPGRLVRLLIRRWSLPRKIRRADADAVAEPVYDFGAFFDVRESAASDGCANYLQELDAAKYIKLIERRATEAIHEFLIEKGADTSDFATKVNFHQHNTVTINGSAYGPVATGTGAAATVTAAVKGSVK
jgi:hypothetical protein